MAEAYTPTTPRNRGELDAPHVSPVTPAEDARTIMINKVSWGAVLAGVVISLVAQLILNMIGVGIGASTIDPGRGPADNPSVSTFSIGAGIWWTVSGVVAALMGGFVAGRLCGQPKESTAAWHGLTAWALTTIVVFYLLTSAVGGVLGGAFNAVAGAARGVTSATGGALQAAAPALTAGVADPFASIERSLRAASGGNDPAALRDAAAAAVRAAVTGDAAKANEAREGAAQAIAKAQNIPIEEARTRVQQYEQQYQQAAEQAKQAATQAADVAAKTVTRAALLTALALVLGAVASWFGGRMGSVEPTVTARLGASAPRVGPA